MTTPAIERLIGWFVDRHLLTNLMFVFIIAAGLYSWTQVKKEEMPDITFDRVRISAVYPGATAEEVEHFVTRELEEELRGIDGVYRITSSASQGSTSVTVELEQDYPNKDEAITEIRNAALSAKLPADVRDKPSVRVFKTAKKAIVDLALYHTGTHLLDVSDRQLLQSYATALEGQLVNLPQIHSVDKSGYFTEEIQISVRPDQLVRYRIPLSQVTSEVSNNHVRQPAGNIEVKNEPKVTLDAQLNNVPRLNQLYVQAGFEGQAISLQEIAEVKEGFRRGKEIIKVNGHEAVMFRVVKNASYGILDSIDAVTAEAERFSRDNLKNTPIRVALLDDESIDVRNRLSIIATNGAIGFVLILATLFLFLNRRSGFWVAMGIPFTVAFTLFVGWLLDYSINNVTLAAVIIVMGIVVDDAIVVAENIGRMRRLGFSSRDAAVQGTAKMFLPVTASIVTTCIAFIPLLYFTGRYGTVNSFMPPIVFLMLAASLFEALVILPGHMHFAAPRLLRRGRKQDQAVPVNGHWFDRYESYYGSVLIRLLPWRYAVFGGFVLLLVAAAWVMTTQMKFVMFPNEETREIVISGNAGKEADRYDTAELTRRIEEIIAPEIGADVVGFRTEIARSRRGGAVQENRFRMIVEIVPREKRERSADQMIDAWKPAIDAVEGLNKLVIQKSRWGQSSGSAVEVLVQENDDALRDTAAEQLAAAMREHPALANVEIERPIRLPEYKIDLQREKIKRLAISPVDISAAFRASLEGTVLYELPKGIETVDVRLSVVDDAKRDIKTILDIPVQNRNNYLVSLGDLVTLNKTDTPESISRQDGRRITKVFADLKPDGGATPLDIAAALESEAFPAIVSAQPTTTLGFEGEIADTRESQGDLRNAVIMVTVLIFCVLAVLYNSLSRPVLIMLAIPFGIVGVVFAFWAHGMELFGFFAAIGTLGMAGVVINDSIIMLARLEQEEQETGKMLDNGGIARVARTRLKAVLLTTLTTVAGVLPTAYGIAGYDAMLSEMMLALAWGLVFGTLITLLLVPVLYAALGDARRRVKRLAA